ncbi:MAG: hypothetical protein AAGA56_15135, partial [Myxococcota bacterium]
MAAEAPAGWIDYAVREPSVGLEDVLLRFGHVRRAGGNDRILRNIWSRRVNRHLWDPARTPYDLAHPDHIWLPPRSAAPNQTILQYRAPSGSSLSDVCGYIEEHHGPQSEQPSVLVGDALTPRALYQLFENLDLAQRYELDGEDVTFTADEMVSYPVTVRRAQQLNVAPSSPDTGSSNPNALPSGESPFEVTLTLEMEDPVMQPLSPDPDNPQWGFHKAGIRIEITAKADVQVFRVRCRVLGADGSEYHHSIRDGDFLEPGSHLWEWDGWGRDGDHDIFDTTILRGRLTVEVEVEGMSGLPA